MLFNDDYEEKTDTPSISGRVQHRSCNISCRKPPSPCHITNQQNTDYNKEIENCPLLIYLTEHFAGSSSAICGRRGRWIYRRGAPSCVGSDPATHIPDPEHVSPSPPSSDRPPTSPATSTGMS